MFNIRYKFLLSFLFIILFLFSCTTYRTNMFIINQSSKVKADFIFEQAISQYESDFILNKNLEQIPQIRELFSDVCLLDPDNLLAEEYIQELDLFIKEEIELNIDISKELVNREKRTSRQSYELIISVQNAINLGAKGKDISELNRYANGIKSSVILYYSKKLPIAAAEIYTEDRYKDLIAKIVRTNQLLAELNLIDPGNKIYTEVDTNIKDFILNDISKDLAKTKTLVSESKFVEAELIIRRAERKYQIAFGTIHPQILKTKYKLFYSWSTKLLKDKKYTFAKNIAKLAFQIERSNEIRELIKTIDSKSAVKSIPQKKKTVVVADVVIDYDSKIDEMLSISNSFISDRNFYSAQQYINNNIKKLKSQDNIDLLLDQNSVISNIVKTLYLDAIDSYNEEDYKAAFDNLKVIIDYDITYEQAKPYYDRVTTKLTALSGSY